jgi:hypothetical protein
MLLEYFVDVKVWGGATAGYKFWGLLSVALNSVIAGLVIGDFSHLIRSYIIQRRTFTMREQITIADSKC